MSTIIMMPSDHPGFVNVAGYAETVNDLSFYDQDGYLTGGSWSEGSTYHRK